jgi:hypothetical protein
MEAFSYFLILIFISHDPSLVGVFRSIADIDFTIEIKSIEAEDSPIKKTTYDVCHFLFEIDQRIH